jgi:predicted nucleic acid-binding protein
MASQQVVLCDTMIFIRLFQGNEKVRKQLEKIGDEQIACSVITYSEIIYGTKKNNLSDVKNYFNSIKVLPLSENISKEFIGLSLNYSYSHHIKIPDAIIAATAIQYGLPLFTENKKDFDFIPEIRFHK